MRRTEILKWLHEDRPEHLADLWETADRVRKQNVGDAVYLRGLLEISNHCRRSCFYCGIRSENRSVQRYRMTEDEILESAYQAVSYGYGTIVLQAGEYPLLTQDFISSVVHQIKSRTNLAVTLSLGERSDEELQAWHEAGADRYLLRFETSNRALYEAIHPPFLPDGRSDRIAIVKSLRSMGYEVGSGVMIGIPGQTWDNLANDVELFSQLDLDMIGVGPFIPHPSTPLGRSRNRSEVPADELSTYKVIALARITCPTANIPATTALATLNPRSGRELGLQRGANVIMPNLTPLKYRKNYEIYPGKVCTSESASLCADCTGHRVESIGRTIGRDQGASIHFTTRKRATLLRPMKMSPRLSSIPADFIDPPHLTELLSKKSDPAKLHDIIEKSIGKNPLTTEETAVLLNAREPDQIEAIQEGAREIKKRIYGNRIVIFAPLYIGNQCVNDCLYCGFRRSNRAAVQRTLASNEIADQVSVLTAVGHKRLILVFGEHPKYSADFIANSVRQVYAAKSGTGEIRRVNINAAPLDHAGFKTVHDSGIGTYQVFQETYHRPTYEKYHPRNTMKGDYVWRLDALSRAYESGCDDVGIGALFGLYDWRFETLGLVAHANHLMKHFQCGPHTISFPRIRRASGVELDPRWQVTDIEFKRLVAILRLAVPYTGLILTCREPAELRREVLAYGVSQVDAGSRIDLGGYTVAGDAQTQQKEREQFELADVRSLDEVIRQLAQDGYIPSFCTACYRQGRTGQHFMEFAVPGFIEKFCTPNALCSGAEYMVDYASPETAAAFHNVEIETLDRMKDDQRKRLTLEKLAKIRTTAERDLYF